ncbi:MAG: hypothetical protein P4L31_03845 [Candidatus Babeliales bacterium]|nr:hypothetical protein [Candidatus Babeliales bacterium]
MKKLLLKSLLAVVIAAPIFASTPSAPKVDMLEYHNTKYLENFKSSAARKQEYDEIFASLLSSDSGKLSQDDVMNADWYKHNTDPEKARLIINYVRLEKKLNEVQAQYWHAKYIETLSACARQ